MIGIIQDFERDIIKGYRKQLWGRFIKAIKRYDLVQSGDKIAVAVSGGKDSLLLAKLFQEVVRHHIMDIEVVYISMDPGYSEATKELFWNNVKNLQIDVTVESSSIFRIAESKASDYPCYLCARMRRGFLYNMAQEQGCNKLALGHHFNDIIETTLMNLFYNGMVRTMIPKVKSDNFEGMELIRPMSLIHEEDIKKLMEKYKIPTMDCGCEIHACTVSSKRQRVKNLIEELVQETPELAKNIYKSCENVDVEGITGWIRDGTNINRYKQ